MEMAQPLSFQPIPVFNCPQDDIQKKEINPYLESQMALPRIVSKDSTDASWDSLAASRREKHLVTLPFKLIFGMTGFVTMDPTCQDSKLHD